MNILLAAWDDNRLIGNKNALPWHLSEDLKLFKERTMGHAVVYGRNTWDSLKHKPLVGRQNVIVSRTLDWKTLPDDVVVTKDLPTAVQLGHIATDKSNVFIIGGAQVYKTALDINLVDKMIITHVYGGHEGDLYFPEFDGPKWQSEVVLKQDKFEIIEYKK